MRSRHFPRLCRSCQAPLARQEDSCWHCGTPWAPEDEPRTRLRVIVGAIATECMDDAAAAVAVAAEVGHDASRRAAPWTWTDR
jgi:hypothetical protein